MANAPMPGLGPWTEVPKLNPKADFAAATLSPQEGFVLSRVDGRTSLGEICLITGLGEEATIKALQKLKAALLIVTSAPMSELPPDIAPPSASKAASMGSGGAAGRAAAAAVAAGTAPSATAAARAKAAGWPENAPVTESARPLQPLTDDQIDSAVLAEGKDLAESVKRRILAFHVRLPDLDYFDRLEVDPQADRQAVRRAYFRLSKEFHPDRYYGKDLGPYREMLGEIFKGISEAFATLSDDSKRQAYVLKLRDIVATPAHLRRKKPR
jgi:hypothetical protein